MNPLLGSFAFILFGVRDVLFCCVGRVGSYDS